MSSVNGIGGHSPIQKVVSQPVVRSVPVKPAPQHPAIADKVQRTGAVGKISVSTKVEGEFVVIAITDNDGKFVAKLRTDDESAPNPLARVVLDRDPSSYWVKFEEYMHGDVKPAQPKKKSKK